ncbi:MAG: hypothetical protein WBQ75_04905 [Acetobacteraceae bacterium]
MADRIALKRLTASDCTLFEAVYRTIGAGNQKSINLNADVLTGKLYPNLAAAAAGTDNEITLALSIYGPNAKGPHKLARKIIRNASYKNWRLDGEFIFGPPSDLNRYDNIQPGDLAIMAFKGEAEPTGMDLILIGQIDPSDAPLHLALSGLLATNSSMVAVSAAQIAVAAAAGGAPQTHPVYIAAADPDFDMALEDAAQSGVEGTKKLLANKGTRKVSGSDLAKTKAKAEITGQEGEGLVNGYLAAEVAAGRLASFNWVSVENAVAPYDFEVVGPGGVTFRIDAKTTTGPFENPIHISLAEIVEASAGPAYRIYRVSALDANGGRLRISEEIGALAKSLKTIHETYMPPGVRVDGFSIASSALAWDAEQYVERPDDEG